MNVVALTDPFTSLYPTTPADLLTAMSSYTRWYCDGFLTDTLSPRSAHP